MPHREPSQAYQGKCLCSRKLPGLSISERVYVAGLEIPPHTHEHAFLGVVLQGSSSERSEGKTWECTAGTVFLRPSELTHTNRVGEKGLHFMGIELASIWLGHWNQQLLPKSGAAVDGVGTGLPRRLYREFRRCDDSSALVLEGLVLEILGETCRAFSATETTVPPWLRRARDILQAQYRRPPSLNELAVAVGVHPLHPARTFRSRYVCTVGEYVRRLRIEFACRALADRSRTLVGIALEAGFADQSQFCRTFKRLVGVTPSQYRRENLAR
jgi:AraC family transcriptional regulator